MGVIGAGVRFLEFVGVGMLAVTDAGVKTGRTTGAGDDNGTGTVVGGTTASSLPAPFMFIIIIPSFMFIPFF
jgi:hypothetical protein